MRRAALLLTVSLLGACGPDPATDGAPPVPYGEVVTEGAAGTVPNPRLRYPSGAQIVRVDHDGTRTVLSEGLDAAGAPCVRHDGQSVLFVAREELQDETPFRVFECAPDGTRRHVVVDHGTDCVRAAYLPDGRIVYAATLPGISPVSVDVPRTALFVADGQGGAGERITFGAGVDTDPTVLSDGRVLFASWRPVPDGRGRLGLFTVHPDGTGYAPFHVAERSVAYPTQQPDLDVRFRVHQADGPVLERIADWDAPMSVVRDADAPLRGESVSLAPRPRPQGHLSSVKPDVAHGTLVCVDARMSGATTATDVQLATYGGERVVLGRTALAEDGSFMALVPPDTPFVVQLLDASGKLVRGEHGPLWLRRNESRVCVTCHDEVERSPPNRRPMAVLGAPADMTGAAR